MPKNTANASPTELCSLNVVTQATKPSRFTKKKTAKINDKTYFQTNWDALTLLETSLSRNGIQIIRIQMSERREFPWDPWEWESELDGNGDGNRNDSTGMGGMGIGQFP
jgi:hypothetical protein